LHCFALLTVLTFWVLAMFVNQCNVPQTKHGIGL
jgi:hypothetical protein